MSVIADNVRRMIVLLTNNTLDRPILPIVRAALCLLLDEGLRIQSVLNLSGHDITEDGRIIVRQGKGSRVRVVAPRYMADAWLSFRGSFFHVGDFVNYMFIYRLFNRYCVSVPGAFGRNTAVTAIGRKAVAQSVMLATDDIAITAEALGHKNTRSTEYYIEKKQQSRSVGILRAEPHEHSPIVVTKRGIVRINPKFNT